MVGYQKRLMLRIWQGVSPRKIWFDPTKIEQISKVKTREELRQLVAEGAIRRKFTIRGEWKTRQGPFLNPPKIKIELGKVEYGDDGLPDVGEISIFRPKTIRRLKRAMNKEKDAGFFE
eukprot:TRINITY_DN8737_c0_g1_i1.p1 TRINITY_DN8737_c0_g1~~TRINITY_DN8737_c0_g1_i1.p1  ORF type:complete len:118 (+),score=11.34 TRINITY_DN8737_c0_g1_i1:255-608(+)